MMKKNVKILYIYSSRFPTEKANGYQVAKMCEGFSQKQEVLLLYPRRKNTDDMRKVKNIYAYYSIKKIFSMKRLFSFEFNIFKRMRMLRLWFFASSFGFAVFVLFWFFYQKNRFDIIYSRSPFVLYSMVLFKKRIRSKIIYETHTFPRSKKSIRVKLAKKVDKMVVITKKIKELYVKAGVDQNKIIVEPDAVDLIQFDLKISKASARKKLKVPANIVMISYVGQFHTMEMEKGIPEIIESAKYLIEEFQDIYFYFVGGPLDREKKYRHIIKNKNLPQKKFIFLEKQPIKDVPLWLKASDILLMPFPKNNHFSYFMSPLKMFEYMASKRPIVGSKLPAIEEILFDKKNALLGKPGEPKGIANNIQTLLLNQQLGKKLAENAFKDVQKYTWEKRARRILKV